MAHNKNAVLFSKIAVARDVLRNRAEQIVNEYIDIAMQAKAAGDYESAYKALQWLIEHMPRDEKGEAIVDRSPDKEPVAAALPPAGPQIRIGIALGGIPQKQLPEASAEVIDAEPAKSR